MSWARIKAEEIDEKICEAMVTSFRGKKLASVMMMLIKVHVAMEERFVFIFLPNHSVDTFKDIHATKELRLIAGSNNTIIKS